MRAQLLILVTGPPGSGKTSVAAPLAASLGLPLVSKDAIKEALADTVHQPRWTPEWSHRLGAATFEAMWEILAGLEEAVVDCNFLSDGPGHKRRLATICERVLEVFCRCPLDLAAARYAQRAASRHPVHTEMALDVARLRQYAQPLALGPVLQVDTTRPVDLSELLDWVRRESRRPVASSATRPKPAND